MLQRLPGRFAGSMFRIRRTWIVAAMLIAFGGVALVVLRRPAHVRAHVTDESAADRFHGFSFRPISNSGRDVPQPAMAEQVGQVAWQMLRGRKATLPRG